MYKIGDVVVYKRRVCEIKDICEEKYKMIPITDNSLIIRVPISSEEIKDVLTYEEVEQLLKNIPNIEPLDCHDKNLEQEYRKLLNSDSHEGLIQIIKTAYLRNQRRIENGKRVGEIDENYFEKAEEILYSELAVSLHMQIGEVREYVIQRLMNREG